MVDVLSISCSMILSELSDHYSKTFSGYPISSGRHLGFGIFAELRTICKQLMLWRVHRYRCQCRQHISMHLPYKKMLSLTLRGLTPLAKATHTRCLKATVSGCSLLSVQDQFDSLFTGLVYLAVRHVLLTVLNVNASSPFCMHIRKVSIAILYHFG